MPKECVALSFSAFFCLQRLLCGFEASPPQAQCLFFFFIGQMNKRPAKFRDLFWLRPQPLDSQRGQKGHLKSRKKPKSVPKASATYCGFSAQTLQTHREARRAHCVAFMPLGETTECDHSCDIFLTFLHLFRVWGLLSVSTTVRAAISRQGQMTSRPACPRPPPGRPFARSGKRTIKENSRCVRVRVGTVLRATPSKKKQFSERDAKATQ